MTADQQSRWAWCDNVACYHTDRYHDDLGCSVAHCGCLMTRKAIRDRAFADASPDSLESSPARSRHREGPVSTRPLPVCAKPMTEQEALAAITGVLDVHRTGPHVNYGIAAMILDALGWPR